MRFPQVDGRCVAVKSSTATRVFRSAVTTGRVVIHEHAEQMATNAGLDAAFVAAEILYAAEGVLVPNRSHPGRFIAHGRATIISVEVEPVVLVVTIMIIE